MGNLFNTCLSVGDSNAFSTVANACEINKQVLYLSNEKGHIIGRKLIALSKNGNLYGFNTYGHAEKSPIGPWVKILFDFS